MIIVGFSKADYTKEDLDKLNDKERYEWALSDIDTIILEDIKDFQDNVLNSECLNCSSSHYWYFLND